MKQTNQTNILMNRQLKHIEQKSHNKIKEFMGKEKGLDL